jgi:hypothetical protein
MWKVKRMNTARIVVLTVSVGAGGISASHANGFDSRILFGRPVVTEHQDISTPISPKFGNRQSALPNAAVRHGASRLARETAAIERTSI